MLSFNAYRYRFQRRSDAYSPPTLCLLSQMSAASAISVTEFLQVNAVSLSAGDVKAIAEVFAQNAVITVADVQRLSKDDLNEMKLSAAQVTGVVQALANASAKERALQAPPAAIKPPAAGAAAAAATAPSSAPPPSTTAPPPPVEEEYLELACRMPAPVEEPMNEPDSQ
jgi:hypothetical protein